MLAALLLAVELIAGHLHSIVPGTIRCKMSNKLSGTMGQKARVVKTWARCPPFQRCTLTCQRCKQAAALLPGGAEPATLQHSRAQAGDRCTLLQPLPPPAPGPPARAWSTLCRGASNGVQLPKGSGQSEASSKSCAAFNLACLISDTKASSCDAWLNGQRPGPRPLGRPPLLKPPAKSCPRRLRYGAHGIHFTESANQSSVLSWVATIAYMWASVWCQSAPRVQTETSPSLRAPARQGTLVTELPLVRSPSSLPFLASATVHHLGRLVHAKVPAGSGAACLLTVVTCWRPLLKASSGKLALGRSDPCDVCACSCCMCLRVACSTTQQQARDSSCSRSE